MSQKQSVALQTVLKLQSSAMEESVPNFTSHAQYKSSLASISGSTLTTLARFSMKLGSMKVSSTTRSLEKKTLKPQHVTLTKDRN